MDYLKTNLKWEDFFTRESVELEDKMQSLDMDSLSKSKLRLALEHKLLDWQKYEAWVLENLGCVSLKNDINENIMNGFVSELHSTREAYSNFEFWSDDLVPVMVWEEQLIVFGIQYNENLVSIKNHIFVLTPLQVLNFIVSKLTQSAEDQENPESNSHSETQSGIEGLSLEVKPLEFDFKNLSKSAAAQVVAVTNPPPPPIPPPVSEVTNTKKIELEMTNVHGVSVPRAEKEVWEFISERHSEYIFEVRKQFTAYLVLKVDFDKTSVFKMDPDLEMENINEQLFNYSLKEDNPFKRVFESGNYESFSVSQLGLNLKNFKYACITAIKCGNKVVGFMVGFKDQNLSEIDQLLLEELARETAA